MIPEEEDRRCRNCQFFVPTPESLFYWGFCKIKLPPHIAINGVNTIKQANEQICDLHRHLNRRIE